MAGILRQAPQLQQLAQRYAYLEHAYFIGRNLDYAVALEASLKLKEISYIHSEAYPAGELKHGTISLIEEGTFVVALACSDKLTEKTMSNIKEVKARGAEVVCLTRDGARVLDEGGRPVEKKEMLVDWDVTSAEKGGHAHFMIKEILEQPGGRWPPRCPPASGRTGGSCWTASA